MAWCETNRVDFLFGPARNARLADEIRAEMAHARFEAGISGKPARRFRDFSWSTLNSWSRARRVIGKAEWTGGEANPVDPLCGSTVVTSLRRHDVAGRYLYEAIYCARGEMENRIKECQLDMFAGRTSAATIRANQPRLWFASAAYVLLCALRRIGLAHTQFATATCTRSGSSCSRSEPRCAPVCDGSASPWHPPARGNTSSHWRTPCSERPASDRHEPDSASSMLHETTPRTAGRESRAQNAEFLGISTPAQPDGARDCITKTVTQGAVRNPG